MSKKVTTKGLQAAFECMKHITTLCTGIIALTVTFAKEFKKNQNTLTVPIELAYAWGFLTLSLLFSIWALLAITGSLNQTDKEPTSNDAMTLNIRIPSLLSLLLFLIGIILVVIAGNEIAT